MRFSVKGIFDTAQKMKSSVKDFFGKCDQIRKKLKKFTEEILNRKLHFLCSDRWLRNPQESLMESIIFFAVINVNKPKSFCRFVHNY